MWIIGHTALAYLLIRGPTAHRIQCDAKLIFLIFIFANITDSLHYPYLRNVIHNPSATIAYSFFWMWFLHRYHLIPKRIYPILMLATLVHIAADLLFSHYLLFLPFDRSGYTLRSWNSVEDIIIEIILVFIFLLILKGSGDLEQVRKFMLKEYQRFAENFTMKGIFNPELFFPYMVVLFSLFTLGQFIIDLVVNFDRLIHGVWYAWVFTFVFLMFMQTLGIFDILKSMLTAIRSRV